MMMRFKLSHFVQASLLVYRLPVSIAFHILIYVICSVCITPTLFVL